MKIAIGTDAYGLALKDSVKQYLLDCGHDVMDFGVNNAADQTPYYAIANEVASRVSQGEFERAILVCGTGMGMSIIANKHAGIYAAVCESTFAAQKSRSINNSNILTLGAMVTAETLANTIVDTWLKTEFTEGWDPAIQEWLKSSMGAISTIEHKQFRTE